MFTKLIPLLLTFLITLQTIICLPGINGRPPQRSAEETREIMTRIMSENGTVALAGSDPVGEFNKRQVINNNCSYNCTRETIVVTDSSICSSIQGASPPSSRTATGTYVTISNSEMIANGDINISISANNNGGLIVMVFDRVRMHATGSININIDNRWLEEGCELWVLFSDVTISPDINGDINIASRDDFGAN